MVRHGVLLMGPAGCGKSTLCYFLQQQYEVSRHRVVCINMDPAAEYIPYKPDIDIKELIGADDAAEELGLGPNGSLVFCIEYLEKNKEWLEEKLLETCEDDLLLFDLPGQIELYVHLDALRHICTFLERQGVRLCVAYCLDITFFSDAAKTISGSLLALNAMLFFELPHINVLTKCDLVGSANIITKFTKKCRNKNNNGSQRVESPADVINDGNNSEDKNTDESDLEDEVRNPQWAGRCLDTSVRDVDAEENEDDIIVEQLLAKDVEQIVHDLDENMPARYRALHRAFASVLEEFGLVSFFPLNISNEESIISLGALLRSTLQADEDEEPRMDYDYPAE